MRIEDFPERSTKAAQSLLTIEELAKMYGLEGQPTCTVEEAARLLRVSRGTAYEAVRAGALPALHLGRRVLIPVPALMQLLGGS